MKYIECPEIYLPNRNEKSIFLAGGISGCLDWQQEMKDLLSQTNLTLVNPRRKNFVKTPENDFEQINWEFNHFPKTIASLFYFPPETLCPITLYELGVQNSHSKPLFIAIHPDYQRKLDVEIQTKLARPDVKIVSSLEDLAGQIKDWARWYS
jgi:hypothetical protein